MIRYVRGNLKKMLIADSVDKYVYFNSIKLCFFINRSLTFRKTEITNSLLKAIFRLFLYIFLETWSEKKKKENLYIMFFRVFSKLASIF